MTKAQRERIIEIATELHAKADTYGTPGAVIDLLNGRADDLRKLAESDDEAENLLRSATMLEEYAPELFGAPENGQEHFGHAIMIGAAESIRDYLGIPKPEPSAAAQVDETATAEAIFRSNLYTRPIPRFEEVFGAGERDALAWLIFEALTIVTTHPAYSDKTPEECYAELLTKVAERITKAAVTAAGGTVVVAAFPDPSKVPDIVKTGFAGVRSTGQIVDRRMYGDAIPIPGNTSLGIPAPLPVSVPACRKCRVDMERGHALQNAPEYSDEGTGSMTGPADMVPVWKCPRCGKSIPRAHIVEDTEA